MNGRDIKSMHLQGNYSVAIDIGEEHPEVAKVLHSSSQAMLGGLFNVLRWSYRYFSLHCTMAPLSDRVNGVTILYLRYLMDEDSKYCDDYRITILRQPVFKAPPPKRTKDGWIDLNKKSRKRFEMTLNFWCLNPSVVSEVFFHFVVVEWLCLLLLVAINLGWKNSIKAGCNALKFFMTTYHYVLPVKYCLPTGIWWFEASPLHYPNVWNIISDVIVFIWARVIISYSTWG